MSEDSQALKTQAQPCEAKVTKPLGTTTRQATLLELWGPALAAKVSDQTKIHKITTKDESITIDLTSAGTEAKQRAITFYFSVVGTVRSMLSIASQVPTPLRKFGANRIPYYFRVMSPNNEWRGIEYPIFEIVLKFLTVKECQCIFARVCKQWKHLDFKMFCSYSSFKALDNSRFSAKELKVVLKKGSKTLPHMRVLKEIIRRDFRNQFTFFNQNILLQTRVADTLLQQIKNSAEGPIKSKLGSQDNRHRLYQTFKIKTQGVGSNHNFLSDKTLTKVCLRSKHSLEDLALKNAVHLSTGCLSESLPILERLVRLDLSYSKQIDDVVIKSFASKLRNLKKLALRFLNEISAESLLVVIDNQRFLEGLDISGCFRINLDILMPKLRENKSIRCLLLEYLFLQPYHLYNLKGTIIHTLSLFYSRTVSESHLDVMKQLENLTNLNVKDCPNVTEEGLFEMIGAKEGSRFKVVHATNGLISERVTAQLQQ